mgnify:CR=1 FL=1
MLLELDITNFAIAGHVRLRLSGGLTAITIFSLVFFAVFARFREQACVLACPYGRYMSSLIDRQTVTVTYERFGRLVRSVLPDLEPPWPIPLPGR